MVHRTTVLPVDKNSINICHFLHEQYHEKQTIPLGGCIISTAASPEKFFITHSCLFDIDTKKTKGSKS